MSNAGRALASGRQRKSFPLRSVILVVPIIRLSCRKQSVSCAGNDPVNKSDPNGHTAAVVGGGGLLGAIGEAIGGFLGAIGSALGVGGAATVGVLAGGILMATATHMGNGLRTPSSKENTQGAFNGASVGGTGPNGNNDDENQQSSKLNLQIPPRRSGKSLKATRNKLQKMATM